MNSDRTKLLVISSLLYLFLSLGLYFGLRQYRLANFSQNKLDEMINTPSTSRGMTTDLCQYSILGNPKLSGDNYVKVGFICSQENKVVSTLSLLALPDRKLETALMEYARIIGFDYSLIANENWYCFLEGKPVKNFSDEVKPTNSLECFKNINLITQ